MPHKKPVALIILDGFGISLDQNGNAIAQAKTPYLDDLSSHYPGALLQASGIEVGLRWGEMGNSEVGHGNLGAGTVVYQNLSRIDMSIEDGSFLKIPAWQQAIDHAIKHGSDIHLMGLLSNGGVHAHIEHLFMILQTLQGQNYKGNIFIHIFTDGQDVAPQSTEQFYEMLEKKIAHHDNIRIATISGRYYSMDKNQNWDRTQKAYECLTQGKGQHGHDVLGILKASYENNIFDESIKPTDLIDEDDQPIGLIKDNDVVIFFNYRADRARQLTEAFTAERFDHFPRQKLHNLLFIAMADYGSSYPLTVAFPPQKLEHSLAQVLSAHHKSQFHIAETEKYAHVTYFFNGGIEDPLPGEDRLIIDSPKIENYDQKPEMSARKITSEAIAHVESGKYDFMVINFANGDMVGHTGNLKAGIKATEVLDDCLGSIVGTILKHDGTAIITADHGNIEEMINPKTGEIDKEHSTNPVPLWIISSDNRLAEEAPELTNLTPQGILADVAPTILDLMDIKKPVEMTGTSLLGAIGTCRLPKR